MTSPHAPRGLRSAMILRRESAGDNKNFLYHENINAKKKTEWVLIFANVMLCSTRLELGLLFTQPPACLPPHPPSPPCPVISNSNTLFNFQTRRHLSKSDTERGKL